MRKVYKEKLMSDKKSINNYAQKTIYIHVKRNKNKEGHLKEQNKIKMKS